MRVRATQTGYDNVCLRNPGDVFEIEERLFSPRWMEKIVVKEQKTAADATPKAPAAHEPTVIVADQKPKKRSRMAVPNPL